MEPFRDSATAPWRPKSSQCDVLFQALLLVGDWNRSSGGTRFARLTGCATLKPKGANGLPISPALGVSIDALYRVITETKL